MKSLLWLIVLLLVVGLVVFLSTGEKGEAPSLNEKNIMMGKLSIVSSAFESGEAIDPRFSCDGRNINPPLQISDIPENTESLVLIMNDPDIPNEIKGRLGKEEFVHWVLFNISPTVRNIEEGGAPGIEGQNTSGNIGYTGPCPPTEFKPTEHRYFFRIYALDIELELSEGATKEDVLKSMEGHILQQSELMGTYDRAK